MDPTTLAAVRSGVESGMYLAAWSAAQAAGPLRSWAGAEAMVLAGRLAMALGAPRLGRALTVRAYRAQPDDPEAIYYHARATLTSRGAYHAFRFMRNKDLPEWAPTDVRADWIALRASVATAFRDFDSADLWLAQAEALSPERPWIAVERAQVLEEQDRLEDALAAAMRPLEASPLFRPGVGSAARILERLGRFEDALVLLRLAEAQLESASLTAHMVQLLLDLDRPEEAGHALERYLTLSPLLEPWGHAWVAARRADAACALGDEKEAQLQAERAGSVFYARIASRLRAPEPSDTRARRILLSVPFIQQQHLTCSPTALASVTSYWGRPVDHIALAKAIAYDGTPGYREREWARANGWIDREFRLTAEVARELIDRGLPFTLSTQFATSAHAQVVAGYDARRGTLLVRDPSNPRLDEVDRDGLLESQAAHGPRCLLLVPPDRIESLAEVTLPDEPSYDALHALELRLLAHDRAGAQSVREGMPPDAPPRILLWMDIRLAGYDADPVRLLAAYEGLLVLFPAESQYVLRRINLLRQLGRHEEARRTLEPLALGYRHDPVFAVRLADMLALDGRHHVEAERLLERSLRRQPSDAAALSSMAGLLWSWGDRAEAFDLYRLAACADLHNEGHVHRFVSAARHLRRADEAVDFLRARVSRLGDRSSAPTRSLFSGLEDLGRAEEAMGSLDAALALHPSDGDLLLFAAEAKGRYGRIEEARAHVEASRGRAKEMDRRRTEARLAFWTADLAGALGAWRDVAAADPLDEDALRWTSDLTSRLEGTPAAQECLRQAVGRAPHHLGLRQLYVRWLSDAAAAEEALAELIRLHPADAWAHRERALKLAELGRMAEAMEAIARAEEIEPDVPSLHAVRGHLLAQSGRREDAIASFRAAVERAPDYGWAVDRLFDQLSGLAAKQECVRLLARLVVEGNAPEGFLHLQRRARGLLAPSEILATLEGAHAERSDVWQAWSALADELMEQRQLDAAAALLAEALERFPLVATLWIDRARVARLAGDDAAEIVALESAGAVAPAWDAPLRGLAEARLRMGSPAEALAPLRRALALDPSDASLAALTADALQAAGQPAEAATVVRRALALDPSDARAWTTLAEVAGRDEALQLARELVAARPRDAEALLALARQLTGEECFDERLTLLERVLALQPRNIAAHDLRARLLSGSRRLEEALAACDAAAFDGHPPLELRGRRAWVLAQGGRRREAIEAMRRLVEEHPDYVWGARALADWTATHGSAAEALAAAEVFVRLSPAEAMAFGYRGDARLRTGDPAGGRADLEHAIALDPAYEFAEARLFDTLMESHLADDAATLLARVEPHLADEPRASQRIRILCLRGDVTGAHATLAEELRARRAPGFALKPALGAVRATFGFDALRLALEAAHDVVHPEAVRALVEVLVEADDRTGARRIVDLVAGRTEAVVAACRGWLEVSTEAPEDRRAAEHLHSLQPDDAESALLLARTMEAEAPDLRVPLYQEALRTDRANLEARDQLATAFTALKRWDAARGACDPVAPETIAPTPLRARSAWIEAQVGRTDVAQRAMRAVLKDDPFSRWGWDRLLEWDFRDKKTRESYLDDAQRHAEVYPGEPSAYGYLGDAYRRLGRPADAEAAFRRGLALDSSYEWGRLALADLLLERGRSADACIVLGEVDPTPSLVGRTVRAALAAKDSDRARAAFERLLHMPGATDEQRREGRDEFTRAGMGDILEEIFAAILTSPSLPAPVGGLWMDWYAQASDWRATERLLGQLRDHPALRREALAALVRALRDKKEARRLKTLLDRERGPLRADDFLWGLAGHALSLVDEAAARRWMGDWPVRHSSSWALSPLALSFRRIGRLAEAAQVGRRALECQRDHVTDCHRAWLAFDAAIVAGVREADELGRDLDFPEGSRPFYEGLRALTQAVLVMHRPGPAGTAFAEARRLLREADRLMGGRLGRDYAPSRRRAVVAIARARGGVVAWLWRFTWA